MRRLGKGALNLLLLVFSISCIYPIFWVLYSSFKTQAEFTISSMALPHNWTLTNYASVLTQSKMGVYMVNSFRTALISVALVVLISFLMGYCLARFRFRGRNVLYTVLLLGMLLPIHALLVPLYIQLRDAGVTNQWFTLIIPYVGFGLSMGVVLTEGFVSSIPRAFEEAAAIDGSGFFRTTFTIMLPLSMPILATLIIIMFFGNWNEFSFSLVLINDDDLRTIPVGLTMFRSMYKVDYPRLMAGMMTALLPVIVLYFLFSDRIIQGMMAGAIKG